MSKSILIINGTARRPAADGFATLGAGWAISQWLESRVKQALAERGIKASVETVEPVSHFKLPITVPEMPAVRSFFNVPITDAAVQSWSNAVSEASAVLFVSPSYNSMPSHTLMLAINHLHAEWEKKPVAVIGYGPGGAVKTLEIFKNYIAPVLKMDAVEPQASIRYSREENRDNKVTQDRVGEAIGAEHADVDKVIGALLDKLA